MDLNKSIRRNTSCASAIFSPSSPTPSLSNRARAVSIFPIVIGDFCQRVKWALQYISTSAPHEASRVCRKRTCGTRIFVKTGVENLIDEKPYSQFSYPIVNRLLLRELLRVINSDSNHPDSAHLVTRDCNPELFNKVDHFLRIFCLVKEACRQFLL